MKSSRSFHLPLCFLFASLVLALASVATNAQGPVPGQNINMVSGVTFPGGDPFLQRQNEPALAVSTRNPLHLLGGSNDYRAVNIPGNSSSGSTGDAWLGVFKSFDGGATWTSTLLPGFPQDTSAQGTSSPLHGLSTASDPLVRAAPAGMFYYSGIAFNRGTNLGDVFVSVYIDLNNVENGDPIQYVRTVAVDSGTAGQFLDKPWLAVGLPTGGTCTLQVPQGNTTVTQTVPAAPVYLLWSRFTGSTSTKIMFSRSLNCGATWSTPTKLSESNSINQGTTIGVGPTGSNLYVAWRRFLTSSQQNAVVVAVSTDAGKTFSKAVDVNDLPNFDPNNPNAPTFFEQGNDSGTFRTNAFPTLAVDGNGRVYLAWSQRGFATGGQARIAMSTSTDGINWSLPFAIDNGPLNDRGSNVLDTSKDTITMGHQFMPEMAFTGGKLMIGYYDQREDHTLGLFTPNTPFVPDSNGLFYEEARDPRGESATTVFTPFLSDDGLTIRRHTLDVVIAQANPGAQPAFTTARVSQYKFGLRNDSTDIPGELQQLQVNPPNFPMFAAGTLPFIGDYIDVAGLSFLSPAVTGNSWQFNTSALKSPTHYITWTDNRDVRPPADGNWADFTPPGPSCVPGQEGDRNQNIYVSRITQGLMVSSPQNSKPLSTSLQRAFVVIIQNFTNFDKTFRLTIPSQPAGGYASFLPGTNNPPNPPTPPSPVTTSLDVSVPAHSGIARPVFATSSNPTATITVNADEITGIGGSLVLGGLSGFAVLNPDPSAPALVNPSGGGGDISSVEVYDPNLSNPNLSNPNLSNPNLSNPNLSNPNLSNPNLSNPNLANPDIANINIANPNLSNPNLANPNLSNPNLANPNLSNTAVSDATYTLTNNGDTTGTYTIQLVGNTTTTEPNTQLIVSTTGLTPLGFGCTLFQEPQNIVLANINNPQVQDVATINLANPNLSNPNLSNSTVAVAPGETVTVTIRGIGLTVPQLQQLTTQMVPVATSGAANTNDATNTPKFTAALFITTASLPAGIYSAPYSATLQAIGGTGALTWVVSAGSLPAGLTLDMASGIISGTPTAIGISVLTVQVSDSGLPQKLTTRDLSITINKADSTTTITSVTPAATSLVGQPITVSWTVAAKSPATGSPTGTVTVTDGLGASCTGAAPTGSCTFTPAATSPTTFTITATYSGDSNFNGSSGTISHSVVFYTFIGFLSPLAPAGTFQSPSFSGSANLGSAVPIKWQLEDTGGNFITSLSTTVLLEAVFTPACVGSPSGPTVVLFSPTMGATGGSTFRYDFTNNQFIFNWATSTGVSTGTGCYTLLLQLNDNSPLKTTAIQLK